jgi:hypothetical protein
MAAEIVFIGNDNIFDRILKADGVAQDLSNVTKIDLVINDNLTITNSTGTDFPIKWLSLGTTGLVQFQIGMESGLINGYYDAQIVVYDATYDDGLVWDDFELHIKTI